MAYATAAELAAALNVQFNSTNEPELEACLNAAATEIDHLLTTDGTVYVEIDPGLLHRVNLDRAVEWYKAPDATASNEAGIGYAEVGTTKPASGFERHAATLLPYRSSWGLA